MESLVFEAMPFKSHWAEKPTKRYLEYMKIKLNNI